MLNLPTVLRAVAALIDQRTLRKTRAHAVPEPARNAYRQEPHECAICDAFDIPQWDDEGPWDEEDAWDDEACGRSLDGMDDETPPRRDWRQLYQRSDDGEVPVSVVQACFEDMHEASVLHSVALLEIARKWGFRVMR